MNGKGIGFGKAILFGEHFVVYGLPGIASAISDITVAEVEKGTKSGWELIDERPAVPGYKDKKQGEIQRSLDLIFKYMKIDLEKNPVKIKLSGNLTCASGVGASAALASAVARALNQHFSLNLNDNQINEVAYEGEKGSAGMPSGIDNTCSTYGGMLSFEKNLLGGPNKISLLKVKFPMLIVLASTGITQETKEIVADVKAEKEKNPEKFEKFFADYKSIYKKAVDAIASGNLGGVGLLMDKNQQLLRDINVSCPEIESIISTAKSNGALGAKLTGTGRGGLVVCLCSDKKTQEKISMAINKTGFETTITEVGKK